MEVSMGNGFQMVPLGELLIPISRPEPTILEKQYSILGAHWYAQGLYVKDVKLGSEIQADRVYRVEEGDFVYNRLFAWKGSFALALKTDDGCYVSNEFPCFRVKENKIDGQYLWKYFSRSSAWNEALGLSSGGTPTSRNRLKEEKLLEMEIPLPSLEDQRRIVARIEELAARIEEARGLRWEGVEETKTLINSVMRRTFSSNNEYQLVPLESVCGSIIDNLHSNPVYADQGIPCVRSPDVGWGKLYLDTALKTSEEEYIRRTARGEPRPNDIVLVREGGGTGKAAIVEEGQRFSLGQRVMMLRPDKQVVMPKFLLYQLLSPIIYEDQILPLSKGSASPHLNIGALRNFSFVLPSLPEQYNTVAYLDNLQSKLDSLKQLRSETDAELDALLPSILDKAFKGKL
jgi:type I restriction enzyme, S subunit